MASIAFRYKGLATPLICIAPLSEGQKCAAKEVVAHCWAYQVFGDFQIGNGGDPPLKGDEPPTFLATCLLYPWVRCLYQYPTAFFRYKLSLILLGKSCAILGEWVFEYLSA